MGSAEINVASQWFVFFVAFEVAILIYIYLKKV